jgi:hypothetical protein
MIAGQLALVVAAVFFGRTFYLTPSIYFLMAVPLAVVGCLLGLLAWWQTGVWLWIVGALIMIANWPYTVLIVDADGAWPEGRRLLHQWVRTALGFAATLVFLWASLR